MDGPQPGEVYRLKKAGQCETRHVTDRTFGNGVVFQSGRYNPWAKHYNNEVCSLVDWTAWRAAGAKLIRKDA